MAVLAMLGASLVLMPTADAQGKADKVDICHYDEDTGAYHEISVSGNAEHAHRNHGDGMVGDAVPGMDGHVFDDDCEPVRNALVRAFGLDADGNEVTFSEWLDSNGDGVPSAGDTVRSPLVPTSFDGTSISPTDLDDCLITNGLWADRLAGYSYALGSGETPDGVVCRATLYWDTDGDPSTFAGCDVRLSCYGFVHGFDHRQGASWAYAIEYDRRYRTTTVRCFDQWILRDAGGTIGHDARAMCGDQPWVDSEATFTP